jgi:hypothetical protein
MGLGSGIRDLGSGINLFRIPDPSRGQRHRIPDPESGSALTGIAFTRYILKFYCVLSGTLRDCYAIDFVALCTRVYKYSFHTVFTQEKD